MPSHCIRNKHLAFKRGNTVCVHWHNGSCWDCQCLISTIQNSQGGKHSAREGGEHSLRGGGGKCLPSPLQPWVCTCSNIFEWVCVYVFCRLGCFVSVLAVPIAGVALKVDPAATEPHHQVLAQSLHQEHPLPVDQPAQGTLWSLSLQGGKFCHVQGWVVC